MGPATASGMAAKTAAAAGLKVGDVVYSIDGHAIDQDGNYSDPDYGKIALIHLISTRHFVGDTVKFSIEREGARQDLPVALAHRDVHSYTIEPYVIDRPPKFFILGGLILGIFAIMKSNEVGTYKMQGNYMMADQASRTTKTLCLISTILGSIGCVTGIILIIVAATATTVSRCYSYYC